MTGPIHALIALAMLFGAATSPQRAYTAKQAVNDLAEIHLAVEGVMKCGRAGEDRRKAAVDKLRPRIDAVATRMRQAFGNAIPTSFKAKHDEDCSSRIRYENELVFKIDRAERAVAALPALTTVGQ